MKRLSLLALLVIAVSVTGNQAAWADSIGVRFSQAQPGAVGAIDAVTVAGVVPQIRWNNVAGANGNSGPLVDNNGVVTGSTTQWTATSGTVFATQSAGGDEALNSGAISGNARVTVSNIPYTRYDLYVYVLGVGGAGTQLQTAIKGGNSFYSVSPNPADPGYLDNNAATPYAYTQAISTNPAAPTVNGNYVVFSNLTGAFQTFLAGAQTSITGFQIVQAGTVAGTVVGGRVPAGTLGLQIVPATFASNAGPNAASGTVTRPDTNGALVVALASGDTSLARVPASVTIPAGVTSVSFAISAVPSTVVRGTRQLHIQASAAGYKPGRIQLHVTDATTAALRMAIHPRRFSEDAGPNAATGEVTRNDVAEAAQQPLVVTLQSSDLNAARVPATVTIPAGQQNATFPVSAVANAGRRPGGLTTVQITGSATGFPTVTDVIVVTDANTNAAATTPAAAATLTLSVTPATVASTAGANAATATVTRGPVTNAPLVVTLRSSETSLARVPATVTIAAGQASATFAVSAVNDPALKGRTNTVHIAATAAGFPNANVALTVTH